ncbi:hypothetical protein [Konateibacter massiliensis]|uniref:hypothetical protein n=1 Tax=Konateibacter massiliensis TaxID=2002841 RepID=UPI000C15B531|nr:hypothetical protein [Konateibacter massiliensis]
MKITKRIFAAFLALTLALGLFLVPANQVEATGKVAVPSKVRVMPNISDTVSFDLPAYGYSIKNLKSSSKNLKAKQTYQYNSFDAEEKENESSATITMYASKEGTYKVSFDIYNASGVKESSKKITVYAKSDLPMKSLKLGNKNYLSETDLNSRLLTAKSGKVSISMAKGYKLKKLEYGVYNKAKDDVVYTTIKNKKKITFGTEVSSSNYSYTSSYRDYKYNYWRNPALAYTYIRVTYTDKYTKTEQVSTYSFYKWVN